MSTSKTIILFTEHGKYQNKAGEKCLVRQVDSDTNIASNEAIIVEGSQDEIVKQYDLSKANNET